MDYYNTLLTSVDRIKTMSSLPDNAWEKVLMPCMKLAQDDGLQDILGTCLYRRLQEMVYDGTISDSGNTDYKYILDTFIGDYLMYETLSRAVMEFSFKLTNLGSIISNDEHVVNLNEGERNILYQTWRNNASIYKRLLQKYLKANINMFPELCECHCGDVKPNLRSSEDIGLWLGGLYGKNGNW